MHKKLLGVAVAVAFAAPTAVLAQAGSGVTIGGIIKVGVDRYSISNTARVGKHSETRVTDNSSRMIFGINESIGGGLSGIAQLDVRFQPDDSGGAVGDFTTSGNTWVGLRSMSLGTITLGRHDLHYGKQPDEVATYAGALQAAAVSLMDFIGTTAIAGATRTNNVVRYDTPTWGGFAATLAYSTNPTANESDLGSTTRRGNAWNVNPSFTSGPFQIGFSHWRQEADDETATSDQRSNVLYGYWTFGGFKVGAAINDSKVEGNAGTQLDRRAWTIPVRWQGGPHHVAAHYSRAKDASGNAVVAGADQTGAKMWAAAYSYLFSKRTSLGLTYARLDNEANANYNFFTNTGALGSDASTLAAGEDGRLIAITVRHAF
jgi:predicted porin